MNLCRRRPNTLERLVHVVGSSPRAEEWDDCRLSEPMLLARKKTLRARPKEVEMKDVEEKEVKIYSAMSEQWLGARY